MSKRFSIDYYIVVKNILKIIAIFVIGTVGGIFADQILWPYFIEKPLFYKYRLEQAPVYVTEIKETTIQENVALTNAVEKVEKVVVGVRTKLKTGKILEGSGIIITSDGMVVTSADLVPQGGDTKFFWEGKKPVFPNFKKRFKRKFSLDKNFRKQFTNRWFCGFGKNKIRRKSFFIRNNF